VDGSLPAQTTLESRQPVIPPRVSVIIPTFQRRQTVLRTVGALDRQTDRDFEVIVVDDGSTDGTAEALQALTTSFPLTVIRQANRGAAHARNAGAARASGGLLLFLDDDMEADPHMLEEHERSHRAGADLVLGDLPLHPESPQNLLSRGVGSWARSRAERLAGTDEVPLADLLTGQVSIARSVFEQLGGFDDELTRNGLFGGEDIDFGYRVRQAGHSIVFNRDAISYQFYDVDPERFLRRVYEAGRSEQELAFKHPERAGDIDGGLQFSSRRGRLLTAPLILAPASVQRPLRALVGWLVRRGGDDTRVRKAFLVARTVERHRGIRAARRAQSTGSAVVLAYHSLSDLRADPVLRAYGLPPAQLDAQLVWLRRWGWSFIDLDALLDALAGGRRLPRRAVLITFDDAYADLLDGASVLKARETPAVVFAVTGRLGQTNDWDRDAQATELPLMDADGLRRLAAAGLEIGSHGATHRRLAGLDTETLERELAGSAQELVAAGLPAPRAISYPHGVHDRAAAAAARTAAYAVAFTVTPGAVRRHSPRWGLPRIEVSSRDTPRRLALKLLAATWPRPVADRVLSFLRERD
jgi:GT2 family glycosyltransferase/peptidoglycan/xylan/chitin deacetylase (PgdA/CDA1 family)